MIKDAEQFIAAVTKYDTIALYIPGSPDPDAIASAYALKMILDKLNIESEIYAEKRLSLPQNQAFIEHLKIPVIFSREINLKKYQAYIVADFQNNRIEYVSDKIPCVAHFDHHGKSKDAVKADFSLIRSDVGSTSTLITLLLKNSNLSFTDEEMTVAATALTFGIQTDTDKYKYITPPDLEALVYLSDFADKQILEGINNMPPSVNTLEIYNKARENEVIYKDWALYGIGFVDSEYRDSIAITADMLIKNSPYKVVAVYAIIENQKKKETYLDVSLRSSSSALDLNRIIKKITPNGGGRRYKGAYQIKLNYLQSTPDKDLLWQVVEAATLETLRKSRDSLYITNIQKAYSSIKDKIRSILK